MKDLKVIEGEVPTEVIAESIVAISEGVKKLRSGRLNDKALFLLIQNAAPLGGHPRGKVSIKNIMDVFAGIESLERTYLKS